MTELDHVILATPDLESGARRVRDALGLDAVPGGRHDGLGTQNMIVPLRRAYIEIVAVVDPEEAARSELGRVISQAVAAAGEGFAGWAVRVEDVATVAARLRLGRDAVGRGGQTAALAGLAEALHTPTLPFFIQRSGPPGTADADAPAIDWLEVSGDAGALSDWLEGAKLPVRVVDGEPEVRRLSVGGRILG